MKQQNKGILEVQPQGDVTLIKSGSTYGSRYRVFNYSFLYGPLLIDNGCSHAQPLMGNFLSGGCCQINLLTHWHEDHLGNTPVIQDLGIPIYGSEQTQKILLNWDNRVINRYRRTVWGLVQRRKIQTFAELETKPGPWGEEFDYKGLRIHLIFTPGHSQDHHIIWEEKSGYLFSGDLFYEPTQRVARLEENMAHYYNSLKLARKIPASKLFCSSGKILNNPAQAWQDKITNLEETISQVNRLYDKGWPAYRIRDAVFKREGMMTKFTSGHFSSLNMVKIIIRDLKQASAQRG